MNGNCEWNYFVGRGLVHEVWLGALWSWTGLFTVKLTRSDSVNKRLFYVTHPLIHPHCHIAFLPNSVKKLSKQIIVFGWFRDTKRLRYTPTIKKDLLLQMSIKRSFIEIVFRSSHSRLFSLLTVWSQTMKRKKIYFQKCLNSRVHNFSLGMCVYTPEKKKLTKNELPIVEFNSSRKWII